MTFEPGNLERISQHHRPVISVGIGVRAINDSNGKLTHTGAHDVDAVIRAVEPAINDDIQIGITSSDIFGHRTPAITRRGESIAGASIVGAGVGKTFGLLHPFAMAQGCGFCLGVPDQSWLGSYRRHAAKAGVSAGGINAAQRLVNECLARAWQARTIAATAHFRVGQLFNLTAATGIAARGRRAGYRVIAAAATRRNNAGGQNNDHETGQLSRTGLQCSTWLRLGRLADSRLSAVRLPEWPLVAMNGGPIMTRGAFFVGSAS